MNKSTIEQEPAAMSHSQLEGEHVYDGITEYDNPTPGWWKLLFAASCVFSVFYWLYFHLSSQPGRTIYDELDRQAVAIFQRKFSGIEELKPDEATLVKYMNDPKWLKVGEATFKANCVSCHGQNGQGLVGPDLTDDMWKNVAKIEDIAKVIEVGAANGSMPAWRNRMSHINQLVLTAAYVASLRGTNPANPKAPGPDDRPIPAWPATSATDEGGSK